MVLQDETAAHGPVTVVEDCPYRERCSAVFACHDRAYCLIGIPRLSQIVGHQVCTSSAILSFFSFPFVSFEV